MTNKGLEGVALRPPPVAERGSKALSEIRSKRKHIYVQRIATVFQTVNLKIKSVDATHSKQLARQKPLHQTTPVIRSIESVQLMY